MGISVLIQLLKNFVYHHVVFLEHMPFFSIHDLTRYDLIRIVSFSNDSNNLSSQVPSTSYTPSHVLPHFPLHHTQHVVTNSFASTDTFPSRTLESPSSPTVPQALSEIVDRPLRRSTCIFKFTKTLDFPILVILHLLLHL